MIAHYLILIVSLNANSISTRHIKFNSQNACLKAMSQLIEMEAHRVTIKARCVAQ